MNQRNKITFHTTKKTNETVKIVNRGIIRNTFFLRHFFLSLDILSISHRIANDLTEQKSKYKKIDTFIKLLGTMDCHYLIYNKINKVIGHGSYLFDFKFKDIDNNDEDAKILERLSLANIRKKNLQVAEINRIIHKEYQNIGIGSILLKKMEEDLRKIGVKKIAAGTFPHNMSSRKSLQNNGFCLLFEAEKRCLYLKRL